MNKSKIEEQIKEYESLLKKCKELKNEVLYQFNIIKVDQVEEVIPNDVDHEPVKKKRGRPKKEINFIEICDEEKCNEPEISNR